MPVRIDEVVAEVGDESAPGGTRSGGAGGGAGGAAGGAPDMDRLDQELERRRQRAARLWAD
jgi:hypothetical protein